VALKSSGADPSASHQSLVITSRTECFGIGMAVVEEKHSSLEQVAEKADQGRTIDS
jgi:hypothetical protein